MQQKQNVPLWKKVGLVLTVLVVAAVAGAWAKSTIFVWEPATAATSMPTAATRMSPLDMMRHHRGDLPTEYFDPL